MNEDYNYIGNVSTVVKFVSMAIAGWTISTLAVYGLKLPVDSMTLTEVIGVLIGLGIGYIDAKYPNTFKFLNNDVSCVCDANVVSDDGVEDINDTVDEESADADADEESDVIVIDEA